MSGREISPRGMPFMPIMVQTLREFQKLPQTRAADDFPEENAYLVGPEDQLFVRISLRRPLANPWAERKADPTRGYFAEAYHLQNGSPRCVVPEEAFQYVTDDRFFVGRGFYERTEVTDESGDHYRDAGPPTIFPRAFSSLFAPSDTPLLPPSGGGEKVGPIGRVIRRHQLLSAGQSADKSARQRIRDDIREGHFPESYQGLSPDITNAHLIVTDEEDGPVFAVSRELGLVPHRVAASKVTSGSIKDPFGDFKSKHKATPLVVTYYLPKDMPGRLLNSVVRDSSEHNAFAVIRIQDLEARPGHEIYRLKNGVYEVLGCEFGLEGLLRKIGFDFLLTNQARDLAAML